MCGGDGGGVSSYLGASSDGDDACEEVSYHRFQGDRQAIYMDGVDQTQTVLFNQEGGGKKRSEVNQQYTITTKYSHLEKMDGDMMIQHCYCKLAQVHAAVFSPHLCLCVVP